MGWWLEVGSVIFVFLNPSAQGTLYFLTLATIMVFSYVFMDQLIRKAQNVLGISDGSGLLNPPPVLEAEDLEDEEENFPWDEDLEDIPEEDRDLLDSFPHLETMQFEYRNLGVPLITLNGEWIQFLDNERKRVLNCLKEIVEKKKKSGSIDSPLECNNCLEKLSYNPSRIPRTLFCGHSFCSECIKTFILTSRNHSLICPDCSKPTSLNLYKPITTVLNVNHSLVELTTNNFWRSLSSSSALKCARCRISFNYLFDGKNPRVSPVCGHSTCELCVREMLVLYDQFKCGTCHDMLFVEEPWKEVFPENHALMEVLAVRAPFN
ncbi:unnamed protein product [Caenorhabditis brenneri]